MKKVAFYTLVAMSAILVACTTVVVKDSGPEILMPGKLIESTDANTLRVKCQGTGSNMEEAVLMARKGCVEWVANSMLLSTPGEKQAYKSVQAQVFAQLDKYIGLPGPGSKDGKSKGIKSRTRINDEKIRVEMIEDVAKTTLQEDLVAMGVLTSMDETQGAMGNPTLMAMPSKSSKGSKLRGIMEGLVNEYLTNATYDVASPKGMTDLEKLLTAIGEVGDNEEDEAARIAMAVGADYFFLYEAVKSKKGGGVAFAVNVNAYETTTAKMVGSKNAIGPARTDWVAGKEAEALSEPLNDAMGGLLPIIEKNWKKMAPKGRFFMVRFLNTPKDTDMAMSSVMKKACSQVKVINSTKSEITMRVQCKMDNMDLAQAIKEGIGAKLGGAEFDWGAKTRSALVVEFK